MPAGDGDFFHPALSRNTGYLISRLGALGQRRFAERMSTLGLTPRRWGVLNVLDHEGTLSQHALGRSVGMDPSSMVSTIDELEAKELVQRHRDPNDRRAYALQMTDAGRDVLTRGRLLAREAQQELLGGLNADERAQLHALLLKVASTFTEAPLLSRRQSE
jgi:DNA-binding MarR family transcriptional regulator